MSHIVRFSVEGLAGRSETYSRTLDRYVNIFFGLNGTGKTSLLKILHSAMKQDVSMLHAVPFERAEVTIYSIVYNAEFTTSISKSRSAPKVKSSLPEMVQARPTPEGSRKPKLRWVYKDEPPKDARGAWRETYLPTWRLQPAEAEFAEYQLYSHPKLEQDWDAFFATSLERIWTRYSTDLLSRLQQIQGDGLVSILKGIMRPSKASGRRPKLDAHVAYSRVRAFLNRQGARGILEAEDVFESRYRSDKNLRKVVDDINGIEERVEKTRAARNSLEQLIGDMFIGPKKVIFSDTAISVETPTGNNIGLASLSSGEKQMLSLLIQCLLAEENSLLIDEPEISLHIDWQRRLISSMRLLNSNAQFVFATHSPEIMADIPDKNIFRL